MLDAFAVCDALFDCVPDAELVLETDTLSSGVLLVVIDTLGDLERV